MYEESGVGILNPLWFVGVVENNLDPRLEGRVQIRAFNIHGTISDIPTIDLPWALCVQGTYDFSNKPPAVNSFVFGFFIDGRSAQQPILLGVIPTQMTQFVSPPANGYGAVPSDIDVSGQGNRVADIGEPSQPKTQRGERLEDTHVYAINATRVLDPPLPAGYDLGATWAEPGSAYAAQYPYNQVKETASGHVIEYDDTPGAERILIYHRSGAYVQVDARGTKTDKAVGDKYDIAEENMMVYVGGRSIVSVQGDAVVYVGGSMTTEVMGDYTMNVHGDYTVNVGGTHTTVAGDAINQQASSIYSEASGASYTINAQSSVNLQSAGGIGMKSAGDLAMDSGGGFSMKGGGDGSIDAANLHLNSGNSGSVESIAKQSFPAPQSKALEVNKTAGNPNNTAPLGTLSWDTVDDPGEMA